MILSKALKVKEDSFMWKGGKVKSRDMEAGKHKSQIVN